MNYQTDALARYLALQDKAPTIPSIPKETPRETKREIARLNALPKIEQIKIFCEAMGISVIEYLNDQAMLNGEVLNQIDYATIGESI